MFFHFDSRFSTGSKQEIKAKRFSFFFKEKSIIQRKIIFKYKFIKAKILENNKSGESIKKIVFNSPNDFPLRGFERMSAFLARL